MTTTNNDPYEVFGNEFASTTKKALDLMKKNNTLELKISSLSEVIKACQDILNNYQKCPQNPHNDPTISFRYLNKLRDALVKYERLN